jgi:HK97 family phage portal protein
MKLWQRAKAAWRSFTNPSPEVLRAFAGGTPVLAGVDVNPNTAITLSAVFACVRNISEDTAKLPLITYEETPDNGKNRRPDHDLYPLLHDSPNDEMSAFDFRQAVVASALLSGGGFAEIERNGGGKAVAIWPIEWWRVRPIRGMDKSIYYEIDGGRTKIPAADMFHLKGFGLNGLIGQMTVHNSREAIGLTMAAERFGAAFFGNGTRTAGVLQRPVDAPALDDEARVNLRDSFERLHQGVENSHRVAILEEGTTWEQTSTDPNEAQMIETRQFQVEEIARIFRVPPHKIQHLLRATFSNIESQSIEYVSDTLMPWAVRIEQEVKRKLVRPSEPRIFVEHLFDAILRGDMLSRAQANEVQFRNGVLTANEWREQENRNKIGKAGDENFIAVNMTTYTKLMSSPASPSPDPFAKVMDQARAILTAQRDILMDATKRMIRTEVDKVRRAAPRPEFAAWATQFYGEHGNHIRTVLQPLIGALRHSLQAIGADIAIYENQAAEMYIRQAVAQVMPIATAAISIAERMEPVIQQWEQNRADHFVAALLNVPIIINPRPEQ